MVKNIADALGVSESKISVKATTEEHLGFTGRGEGISCQAGCLLYDVEEDLARDARASGCQSCSGCHGCPVSSSGQDAE